jgi:hypothetical protein
MNKIFVNTILQTQSRKRRSALYRRRVRRLHVEHVKQWTMDNYSVANNSQLSINRGIDITNKKIIRIFVR